MAAYPFREIETRWQDYWDRNETFRTPDRPDTSRPKFYVLDMFSLSERTGSARRPSGRLHGFRHRRALQAHARLQCAAPDGLGRLRSAHGTVRDQDRHSPEGGDGEQRRELSGPTQGAWLFLRLGPRGQYDGPCLLPLDPVDLQATVRARTRLPRRTARLVVPRNSARPLPTRKSSTASPSAAAMSACAVPCGNGCSGSPNTRTSCWPDSTNSTGPTARRRCSANWIGPQ